MKRQAFDPALAASSSDHPIGVFDSGIGGLSVLRALQVELPHERFVYFADTAHAPYGERSEAYVIERTRAVASGLVAKHGIKALVVACNTATAAAIHVVRAEHPSLLVVGVEPALKPAVAASRSRHVAVLATRGTLASAKFAALHAALVAETSFHLVPCDGLAHAIESGDDARMAALCAQYVGEAGRFGDGPGEIDTLVLGCTHYPLVSDVFQRLAGADVRLLDTGAPVAQQTRRLLTSTGLLRARPADDASVLLAASGDLPQFKVAAERWLLATPVAASTSTNA
ncbi:glutamate racemase [Variovorax sp. LT2P21]|uniref:glutamate racemase n=1 Tax=Variovorax sp. LT2P21 TaxID=3443731 RepID=UPI003F4489B8